MSFNPVNTFMAERKMSLKNSNHCLSFVNTLWKGEVIMCTFNNLDRSIVDIFCAQIIEPDEFEELERMINDFIFGG